MNDGIPFVAIGVDELGLKVKEGDKLKKGRLSGILEYGTCGDTGKKSNVMGVIQAQNGECYLAAIKDQLVFGWEKEND